MVFVVEFLNKNPAPVGLAAYSRAFIGFRESTFYIRGWSHHLEDQGTWEEGTRSLLTLLVARAQSAGSVRT